jgi:hypothetical protein
MLNWEHFDLDGAIFRRPSGGFGVTHVYGEKSRSWAPYAGQDKIKPVFFGDRCSDPMAGAMPEIKPEDGFSAKLDNFDSEEGG